MKRHLGVHFVENGKKLNYFLNYYNVDYSTPNIKYDEFLKKVARKIIRAITGCAK